MLARRYSPPFFAFFPQFRDATGWEGKRTADAVALGLYATRGYALHGFEIKVNRGDWLGELKNAKKADAVGAYCDRWWIVAPKGVILPGEVPDAWGWLEATHRGIKGIREAPERKAMPMDRGFIASLVQRATGGRVSVEAVSAEEAQRRATVAYERGRKAGAESVEWNQRDFTRLQREVEAFKKASGLDSLEYNGRQAGEMVKLLEKLGWERPFQIAEDTAGTLVSWANEIRTKAREVREAVKAK